MSEINQEGYKACPNCGAIKFYIDNDTDEMVFFRVPQEGKAVSSLDPPKELDLDISGEIYCVSCGWHGKASELK